MMSRPPCPRHWPAVAGLDTKISIEGDASWSITLSGVETDAQTLFANNSLIFV